MPPTFRQAIREGSDRFTGRRILVVDDGYEPPCRGRAPGELSGPSSDGRVGAEVSICSSTIKSGAARRHRGMPGEDGYTLIRKLRSLNIATSNVPAAALTAFAREEDRNEALEAGYQLHLSKPIDASSLIAAVSTLARWNVSASTRLAGA